MFRFRRDHCGKNRPDPELITSLAARAVDSLANVLFPRRCLACHGSMPSCVRKNLGLDLPRLMALSHTELVMGQLQPFFCPDCLYAETTVSAAGQAFHALAFSRYEGVIKESIHLLKYRKKMQLAKPLGILLFTAFRHYFRSCEPDLILPVPLHLKRLRQRGFNQVFLMIRSFERYAAALGEGDRPWAVEPWILARTRETESQTGLDRSQRQANVMGAFTVENSHAVKGRRILVVDDVYTTGATVREAKNALLMAGAESVDALVLARA
ncbi:MAG: ComF family protein [Pseudomonadota bacterium]